MKRFFRNQDKLDETRIETDLSKALQFADAVIFAVRHQEYLELDPDAEDKDQIVEYLDQLPTE